MTSVVPTSRLGRLICGGYIALVAATILFIVATFRIVEGDGTANMSPVWLIVVTMPWSLAAIIGNRPGHMTPWGLIVIVILASAVLNAFLLGKLGDRLASRT